MKGKHLSRLQITLLVSVAVMLTGTSVMAGIYPQPDGICVSGSSEETAHLCFTATITDTTGYVFEIWPDSSGNWPIVSASGKEFRYKVTPIGKPDNWNYIVLGHPFCNNSINYITDWIPSGAQLSKDTFLSACPLETLPPGVDLNAIQLLKLNPTKTKSFWSYSVITTLAAGTTCSMLTALNLPSKGCRYGLIQGPGCDPGVRTTFSNSYDNGNITVTFYPCGYTNVTFKGYDTCTYSQPAICIKENLVEVDCQEIQVAGEKDVGCIFIQNPNMVLYGPTLYLAVPVGEACPQ